MRVLIVAPKVTELKVIPLPLGLAYISAQMKRDGHNVYWLNLNHHSDDMELLIRQAMCLYNPDIIATGGMYLYMEFTRKAFVMARRVNPHIFRLTGGSGVTAEPELFMDYTGADVGIIGEGEYSVSELLRLLSESPGNPQNESIPVDGIIYRNHLGDLVRTPERKQCKSLEDYPWPDLEGFDYEHTIDNFQNIADFSIFAASVLDRPRMIPLITSRACPYTCTFCFHASGRSYTERSLDDVFSELDYHVKKYCANFVIILDEVFSPKANRMKEFCDRIKPYNLKWWCQSHIKMSDKNRLAMMRDAGCVGLSYGLESMNNSVLSSMQKKNKAEDIANTLQVTYESQLDVQGNFIFGDKAETLETAEETLSWWEKNLHHSINLTMISLYPRSEMYIGAVDRGVIKNPFGFISAGCPVVNASNMTDSEFAALRLRIDLYSIIRLFCQITDYGLEKSICDLNGSLYWLSCMCPHCGASSKYRDVALPYSSHTTFFLACRKCFRRFAPPIYKRSVEATNLDQQHILVEQTVKTGNLGEAERICKQNLVHFPFHDTSLFLLAKIFQQYGFRDRSFNTAQLASIYNPAKPEILELLAETLPSGFVGRSSGFLRRHAGWLRERGVRGIIYVAP